MYTFEVFNLATGQVITTVEQDDPRIRPITPDGCGVRQVIAAAPPVTAPSPAEPPPSVPPEADAPSAPSAP